MRDIVAVGLLWVAASVVFVAVWALLLTPRRRAERDLEERYPEAWR